VGVSFRGWVGVAVSVWQTCPNQRSAQHNTTQHNICTIKAEVECPQTRKKIQVAIHIISGCLTIG